MVEKMEAAGEEKPKNILHFPVDLITEFRTAVIVCPTEEMNPRLVATILGRRDHKVKINHHWTSDDSTSSSCRVWGGAVAKFSSFTFMRVTAKDLQKQSLKVMRFNSWIEILRIAEYLHPKKENKTTKIFLSAAGRFDDEVTTQLKKKLRIMGNYKRFALHRRHPSGSFGTVEYCTQLEAYAAKIVLNGQHFNHLGYLNVKVKVSKSGAKFDRLVKRRFREFLERACNDDQNFNCLA